MPEIETIETLDRIFMNVYEWSVGVFGPTFGAIIWLMLLGFMLYIIVPTGGSNLRVE